MLQSINSFKPTVLAAAKPKNLPREFDAQGVLVIDDEGKLMQISFSSNLGSKTYNPSFTGFKALEKPVAKYGVEFTGQMTNTMTDHPINKVLVSDIQPDGRVYFADILDLDHDGYYLSSLRSIDTEPGDSDSEYKVKKFHTA